MRDDAELSMRYRADKGIHDKKSEIEDTRIRNIIDSSYAVDGQAMRVSYGSFLLMKAGLQQAFEHRIAKSTKPMNPRINLTFRIVNPGANNF